MSVGSVSVASSDASGDAEATSDSAGDSAGVSLLVFVALSPQPTDIILIAPIKPSAKACLNFFILNSPLIIVVKITY